MKRVQASAAVLIAWLAAGAWAPDPTALKGAAGGQAWSEVQAGPDGAALIHAVIDIPVAPRTVWAVMNDCRYIPKMIGSVVSCRIVQGDAEHGGWDVRETVTRGNFFIPTIQNLYRSDYQPYSLIRFHKVGGNLKVEQGEWRLESLNGGAGTRVIYENLVAAAILAPAPLVREGMRKDTAKVLANLRRVAMSVGR